MTKIVNISVLVDAANLADKLANGELKPGSQDSPTSLGSWGGSDNFIYMVAKRGVVSNNQQAKSELEVDAETGDTIKWNMITFGQMATYSAFIYDSHFNMTSGEGHIAIQNVSYENQVVGVRIPQGSNPKSKPLGAYANTIYTVSADVTNINQTIQYTMTFELLDEASGRVLGYFTWDPFIKIPF